MRNIDYFISELSRLPPNQRAAMERILDKICKLLLDGDLAPQMRDKRFSQIESYLTNKVQRDKNEVGIDDSEFLRVVRNSLQHGPSVSTATLEKAMPIFWRVLEKSGPEWHREHIDHLLSYAIGRRSSSSAIESDDSNGLTVIRHYEKLFKRLAHEDRMMIFRDLFLSIYLRPEFQQALGISKQSGSRERGYER